MLRYLLFCTVIAPAVLGSPMTLAQSDIASHIVILTPQAQLHLEPAIKYDPAAFIHHLSPLARIVAPHDETIVYVPASAGASIIPIENLSVGRASGSEQHQKLETKQWDQISQQIQQAVQTGSAQLGPQLSEAASAASSAAAAAGQGLFPALFPPAGPGSGKEDKPKITYELPANTETLLPNNARIYALTPAVSHVVDFVHSPIFLGPLSAIRARSIQEGDAQTPLTAASLKDKIIDLKETNSPQSQKEHLHKPDYGRFAGANALKEKEAKLSVEKPSEDQHLDFSNKLSDTLKEGLADAASPVQPPRLKIEPGVDKNVHNGVSPESQPQSKAA